MTALDRTISLVRLLKWEAPGGTVRLCDGGFVDFAGERYESWHPVWGTLVEWPELEAVMDELSESASLSFYPNPAATVADWWRVDLPGGRVRLWEGELDADMLTVINATQQADMLVDDAGRVQGPDGSNRLDMDLTGRGERLFLINEGNVCSDRFHQSVWTGELGFVNCTDVPDNFAWGVASTTEQPVKGDKAKKAKKGGW